MLTITRLYSATWKRVSLSIDANHDHTLVTRLTANSWLLTHICYKQTTQSSLIWSVGMVPCLSHKPREGVMQEKEVFGWRSAPCFNWRPTESGMIRLDRATTHQSEVIVDSSYNRSHLQHYQH